MLDDALSYFLPDYLDLLQDMLSVFAEFLVAGVLVSFIFWAIAIAVGAVFGWLDSWSSSRG